MGWVGNVACVHRLCLQASLGSYFRDPDKHEGGRKGPVDLDATMNVGAIDVVSAGNAPSAHVKGTRCVMGGSVGGLFHRELVGCVARVCGRARLQRPSLV